MSIVTGNTKTLAEALARIETLEAEKSTLEAANAHLIAVIKARTIAGYVNTMGHFNYTPGFFDKWSPVYFIGDEFDAAGFLITPEVKIEQ